jgi:hypothetical protein
VGKTKGTVVLKAIKVLRSRKKEALAHLPRSLHHYLDERIVVASWYPEEDFYEILCATAALFPGDGAFELLGAATAKEHAEGMYADIMKRDWASRVRIMWKTQHDSGDFVLTNQTDNSATYELRGWPHASPKYCRVVGGYFTELHRLAGVAAPTYSHPKCCSAKAESCVFVVTWL